MQRPGLHRSCRPGIETLEDRTVLASANGATLDLHGLSVDSTHATDHLLVRFKDGVIPAPLPGSSLGAALPLVSGLFRVDLAAGVSVEQALAGYRADSRVAFAEPDYHLLPSWTPNDTLFTKQWDFRNTARLGADVNAPAAWAYAIGSRRTVVSVMDTGIDYTHPDLYQNIWIHQGEIPLSRRVNLVDIDGDALITFRDLNHSLNKGVGKILDQNGNGYIDGDDLLRPMIKNAAGQDTGLGGWADGISQTPDGYIDDIVGWNFYSNNNRPLDDNGHGTHVAGTIGAMGNNGTGVAGISWQVQLMPIKFFGASGTGSISQFIAGLNYAVAHGARISNNSWAGAGNSFTLQFAIDQARKAGHLFVAAAGNAARNNDLIPEYPASFPLDNIVTVAATDANDHLASFSNYGKVSVDLAAPGVNILSTNPGKSYGLRSGTSMATPHVTGVLALVWSLRPYWNYKQVLDHVLATADRLPSLTNKVAAGRVDAGNAVRALFGLPMLAQSGSTVVPAQTQPASTGNGPGLSSVPDENGPSMPGQVQEALADLLGISRDHSAPLPVWTPTPSRPDAVPHASPPVPMPKGGPAITPLVTNRTSGDWRDELFADPLALETIRVSKNTLEALLVPRSGR